MAELTLYYASVSASKEIKGKQQKIIAVLEAKKYDFTKVDIAESEECRTEMQNKVRACDPAKKAPLPPQLFLGDKYLGDYEAFDDANEIGELSDFLSGKGSGDTK